MATGRIGAMSANWLNALHELAARLEPTDVRWMLVGSAATALRVAAIEPGDLDIAVATSDGVRAAAKVLPSRADQSASSDELWFSSLSEPTTTFTSDPDARWTFGRWLLAGIKVELAHIDGGAPPDLLRETSGTPVWDERTQVSLDGVRIPIVPIEVQLATMIFREQDDRLQTTLSALNPASIDLALLRRAVADRQEGEPPLRVPDAIQQLLTDNP
jgi:hypothetical protein